MRLSLNDTESYPCYTCGSLVIKLVNVPNPKTGKPKVMNYVDGLGGYKGQEHDHRRPAINWKKHNKEVDENGKHCPTCNTTYFPNIFSLCPNCSVYQCIVCGEIRLPKKGIDCKCGNPTYEVTPR